MKRRQGWLFFTVILIVFSIFTLLNSTFQLGLDLKGGSQLTLQLVKQDGKVTSEELESVKAVLPNILEADKGFCSPGNSKIN